MESEGKINYSLLISILFTLVGWGVTFGICQQKIDNNSKNIERLEQKQNSTEQLFQSVNNNLVELNTKVNLLLNGSLTTGGK